MGFLPPWNLPLHCWGGGLLSKAISSWTCLQWDMGPETHMQLFLKENKICIRGTEAIERQVFNEHS